MQDSPSYLGGSMGAPVTAQIKSAQFKPSRAAATAQFTAQPQAQPQFTAQQSSTSTGGSSSSDVSDVDWDVYDYVPDVSAEDVQSCMGEIDTFKAMLSDVTNLTNISIDRAVAIAQKINDAGAGNPEEHLAWVAVLAEELGNENIVACVDVVRSYLFDQQDAAANGASTDLTTNGNGTDIIDGSGGPPGEEGFGNRNGDEEVVPFYKTWKGMAAIGVGSLAAIALGYWAYKKYGKADAGEDFDEEDLVLGGAEAGEEFELDEEVALNPRPRVRLNRRKKRKNKKRRKSSLLLN
jgi:hypothetical protein